MLLREQELASMQEEYEELEAKLEVVKSNIQVLSLSLKNLNRQLDAVRRTVFEAEVLLSTSQFGTKKLKTSLSSKTTKGQKTTESEN